jgi:low temperature requirement protein LtrA
MGSFLIAKLLRIALYCYYSLSLPKYRTSFFTGILGIVLQSALYFPLLFVTSSRAIVALASAAVAVETLLAYFYGASVHFRARSGVYIPAINVEHLIERTLQFTVIFFGETVIASIYRAGGRQFGPHR